MKSPPAESSPVEVDEAAAGRKATAVCFAGALFVAAVLVMAKEINPALTVPQMIQLGFMTVIVVWGIVVVLSAVAAKSVALFNIGWIGTVLLLMVVIVVEAPSAYVNKDPCEIWTDRFWTQTPQACTPDKVPVDPVTEASAYLACARLSDSADRRRALRAAAQHRLDGQDPLPVYEVSLKDCGHWRSLAYGVVDDADRARRQEEVMRVRRVRLGERVR